MSALRRALHEERGVSLVEFALIAPVLMLILVGILDFGRAINAYVTVGNAAREGTHYISVHPTAAPSAIETAIRQRVVPLDPSRVTVTATYDDGSTFRPWPASPTPNGTRTPVRVTVSYPWSAATFIGQFFPGGAGATFTVSSTVEILR